MGLTCQDAQGRGPGEGFTVSLAPLAPASARTAILTARVSSAVWGSWVPGPGTRLDWGCHSGPHLTAFLQADTVGSGESQAQPPCRGAFTFFSDSLIKTPRKKKQASITSRLRGTSHRHIANITHSLSSVQHLDCLLRKITDLGETC